MAMLGLGNSVGTSAEGIRAEVVTVADEAALKDLGDSVRGKIVHFNNPMPAWTPDKGACYGTTVYFRVNGARLAAAQGAVAVLVRSVTAHSLRSPHTGMLSYRDATTKIPAAAISTEDSDYLGRQKLAGQRVQVHLKMDAHFAEPIQSANAVAEWVGREHPEQIVLVSGHIDSWDVGQGAHDDGAGVVMAMEALSTFKRLGLRPRRTVRMVLWTNEENGMAGARAYLKRHKKELGKHVAAIEADAGGFAPDSFGLALQGSQRLQQASTWIRHFNRFVGPTLGHIKLKTGRSAPDVGHFVKHGVAAVGLYTYSKHYFDYHHTEADTVDKVDPKELSQSAAAIAALVWSIAEHPQRWDHKAGTTRLGRQRMGPDASR